MEYSINMKMECVTGRHSFRRKDIKISMSTADGERRPTLNIIDGAGGKGPRISRETRNGGSTCTGELRRKLGSFSFECA